MKPIKSPKNVVKNANMQTTQLLRSVTEEDPHASHYPLNCTLHPLLHPPLSTRPPLLPPSPPQHLPNSFILQVIIDQSNAANRTFLLPCFPPQSLTLTPTLTGLNSRRTLAYIVRSRLFFAARLPARTLIARTLIWPFQRVQRASTSFNELQLHSLHSLSLFNQRVDSRQ